MDGSGGQDGDYKEERLLGFCSVEWGVFFLGFVFFIRLVH